MTLPDYQSLMLPVLSISPNEEVRFGDSVDRLAAPALFQAFVHHHAAGQVDLLTTTRPDRSICWAVRAKASKFGSRWRAACR